MLKFNSLFTSPIKTTYDSYNQEVIDVITPNFFTGLRMELTKTILPFLQISTMKSQNSNHTSTTFSSNNTVFQFSFDSNRNYQAKSSHLLGPVIGKFYTIVSKDKDVFTQIEALLNRKFYNIAFKLISPAFEASNLIYIVNYFATIRSLSFGVEAVGMKNDIGLSLSTRLDNGNTIYNASLQRFNQLTASYYHKLQNTIEIGLEARKSRNSDIAYSSGIRVRNRQSEVKCTFGSDFNLNFYWKEHLSENLRVEFSSLYDWDQLDYGISLIYEE